MTTAPGILARLSVVTLDAVCDEFYEVGEQPSAADLLAVMARLGRNFGPALLSNLACEELLSREAAACCVPDAWSGVEWPNRALPEEDWWELFYLAGYTVDGQPARRPSRPLRLFRGAVPEHRAGWSWTDDVELADWFARRYDDAGKLGEVWTVTAPSKRLLARISTARPGESEYVIDTRDLVIHQHER